MWLLRQPDHSVVSGPTLVVVLVAVTVVVATALTVACSTSVVSGLVTMTDTLVLNWADDELDVFLYDGDRGTVLVGDVCADFGALENVPGRHAVGGRGALDARGYAGSKSGDSGRWSCEV